MAAAGGEGGGEVEADRAAARVGAGCCVRARANLRRR